MGQSTLVTTSLNSVNLQMEGLLQLVAKLCDERDVQATVTGSLKGGAIAGAATMLGGLTLGPLGLAVGGAVGGGLAAWLTQGDTAHAEAPAGGAHLNRDGRLQEGLLRPGCLDPDRNGRQFHPGGAPHLRCHLPQGAGFTSERSLDKMYLIFYVKYVFRFFNLA